MTTVRLWTILGEAQTGKSRTVRELASFPAKGGRAGFQYILLRGGGFNRVYAKRMAWQEDRKTPQDSIAEIQKQISLLTGRLKGAPFSVNVLSTLRFDPILHRNPTLVCPSGEEYLQAWAAMGWSLESLVLMSPDKTRDFYGEFGVPTAWLYDSRASSIGEMVGQVRNHFGWA